MDFAGLGLGGKVGLRRMLGLGLDLVGGIMGIWIGLRGRDVFDFFGFSILAVAGTFFYVSQERV